MAKNDKTIIPKNIQEGLNKLAKGLGVAVGEVWMIFVRQYIVRGVSFAFTGILMLILAWFLWQYIHLFTLPLIGGAIALFYGTIMYVGNPKYYALEDITGRIKEFKDVVDRRKTTEIVDRPSNPYRLNRY